MKKTLKLLLAITLIAVLFIIPTIALADAGADPTGLLLGFLDPEKVAETVLNVFATAAITAIGVGGTWLTVQIGKNKKFERIANAMYDVTELAKLTVGELKQTIVDKLKAEHGTLTDDEIFKLRTSLVEKTKEKVASAVYKLLTASAVDVEALILGVGEDLIGKTKGEKPKEPPVITGFAADGTKAKK